MGKVRRGGYVFVSWIGDHGNHVHVFRNGKLVLKWDLDFMREELGYRRAPRRLRRLIAELTTEGVLGYENKKSKTQ